MTFGKKSYEKSNGGDNFMVRGVTFDGREGMASEVWASYQPVHLT